uniref:Homeobox domain-containing protein n=1 Tax=Steinernema glaseri TaxID=37863 RepID=A0A1I7Y981_9BILA
MTSSTIPPFTTQEVVDNISNSIDGTNSMEQVPCVASEAPSEDTSDAKSEPRSDSTTRASSETIVEDPSEDYSETNSVATEAPKQNEKSAAETQEAAELENGVPPVTQQQLLDAASHHFALCVLYMQSAILLQRTQAVSQSSSSLVEPLESHDEPSSASFRRGREGRNQKRHLEELWEETRNPTREQRANVAKKSGLSLRQVTKWFQNQRSKQNRDKRERNVSVLKEPSGLDQKGLQGDPEEKKME